jgi:N-sulfoglucosamine sulfohydrolase
MIALTSLLRALAALAAGLTASVSLAAERPPINVLLITADDLNADSVGAYGAVVSGATPNLDRLAAEGVQFMRAHVVVGVCQPSRNAMNSGRYPHRSGGEAFHRLRNPGIPVLPTILQQEGYLIGVLNKLAHSIPYVGINWDLRVDGHELGRGRNPEAYHRYVREIARRGREEGRPFYLMANIIDPHRPFYGNDSAEWYTELNPPAVAPSKVFSPEEVVVPPFLVDVPEVRREVAEYYSSVRRGDDTLGAILRALEEEGVAENTLLIFLSDNGMAMPFAKSNCYLVSTHTPLVVRWPAGISGGQVERQSFVSGIDILPTIMEALELPTPEGVDGRSFLPLMRGETQPDREYVFTQYYQTSGKRTYPMRAVQSSKYGYIWNAWHDGKPQYSGESLSGRTMRALREAAAAGNDLAAARVRMLLVRVPEEFYDLENDPYCLNNLIDDPTHADEVEAYRGRLLAWMVETGDLARAAFEERGNDELRGAYIAMLEQLLLSSDPGFEETSE